MCDPSMSSPRVSLWSRRTCRIQLSRVFWINDSAAFTCRCWSARLNSRFFFHVSWAWSLFARHTAWPAASMLSGCRVVRWCAVAIMYMYVNVCTWAFVCISVSLLVVHRVCTVVGWLLLSSTLTALFWVVPTCTQAFPPSFPLSTSSSSPLLSSPLLLCWWDTVISLRGGVSPS